MYNQAMDYVIYPLLIAIAITARALWRRTQVWAAGAVLALPVTGVFLWIAAPAPSVDWIIASVIAFAGAWALIMMALAFVGMAVSFIRD